MSDGDIQLFGFILMAKLRRMLFYVYTKQERDQWITAMARSCVLLNINTQYKLCKQIGVGASARVHTCYHKDDPTKKLYAIKTLKKSEVRKSNRSTNHVLTEIDILRDMSHPNIIKLHSVFESNNSIHLILEYLEGGELFDRIKQRNAYTE